MSIESAGREMDHLQDVRDDTLQRIKKFQGGPILYLYEEVCSAAVPAPGELASGS